MLKKTFMVIILFFLLVSLQTKVAIAEDNLDEAEIFKNVNQSVLALEIYDKYGNQIGKGSAFIIDNNGKAATNYHVIENAYSIRARLSSGEIVNVTNISYYDKNDDIALIVLDNGTTCPPPIRLGDSSNLVTGQKIFAIGNPSGSENTISKGIISAVNRKFDYQTYIQITTPISEGCSGGVLLNGQGCAIGVTTAYYDKGQNVNFAIPISHVIKGLSVENKTALNIYQKIVKDLQFSNDDYYFYYPSNWITILNKPEQNFFIANADNNTSTICVTPSDITSEDQFFDKVKEVVNNLSKTLVYNKQTVKLNNQPAQINGNIFYQITVSGEINGTEIIQDVRLTCKNKKMLMFIFSSTQNLYKQDETAFQKVLSTLVFRNINENKVDNLSIVRKTMCWGVYNNHPDAENDKYTTSDKKITCFIALSETVSEKVITNWYYYNNNERQLITTIENIGTNDDLYWSWIRNETYLRRPGKWECEICVRDIKESLFFTVESVIQFRLNDIGVSYGAPPILENGRVLVPFRGIASSLGADVDWDETERKITLTMNDKKLELVIGSETAKTNNGIIKLSVPAKIVINTTYVPLRFIGEFFGANIEWDPETNIVYISTR